MAVASEKNLGRIFASQHGLITRVQALSKGLSSHRIAHLLESERWERVHVGVYRLNGSPVTWHQHVLAACLAAAKGAVVSHRTAARVWGMPLQAAGIELTVPLHRCISIMGATVHRSVSIEASDRRVVGGIPVTGAARTTIDLAAVLEEDELEVILDDVLSRRLVTARDLDARLEALGTRGRKGAGRLGRLLATRQGRGRAPESAFETFLSQALRRGGLPAPVPQFRVRLPSGRFARVDFAYPQARLVVEADSYRYHSSFSAWSRDRVRHNELVALGWRVLPIKFSDIRNDGQAIADQIRRCLALPEV